MQPSPVSRRALLAGACLSALLTGVVHVQAQGAKTPRPFTPEAFAKAQAAGQSILVEVHAPWCPTCKAQKPILDKLTSSAPLNKLTVFSVDFDSQKEALRQLRAGQQSTLIAFKGKDETGRSVGDTRETSIETLLKSAL